MFLSPVTGGGAGDNSWLVRREGKEDCSGVVEKKRKGKKGEQKKKRKDQKGKKGMFILQKKIYTT